MNGRSLEQVNVDTNEMGEPVLVCLCDCGATTEIVVMAGVGESAEFAFTCHNCQSPHWLTVTCTDRSI